MYNPILSKLVVFKPALFVNCKKLGRDAYNSELLFSMKNMSL